MLTHNTHYNHKIQNNRYNYGQSVYMCLVELISLEKKTGMYLTNFVQKLFKAMKSIFSFLSKALHLKIVTLDRKRYLFHKQYNTNVKIV